MLTAGNRPQKGKPWIREDHYSAFTWPAWTTFPRIPFPIRFQFGWASGDFFCTWFGRQKSCSSHLRWMLTKWKQAHTLVHTHRCTHIGAHTLVHTHQCTHISAHLLASLWLSAAARPATASLSPVFSAASPTLGPGECRFSSVKGTGFCRTPHQLRGSENWWTFPFILVDSSSCSWVPACSLLFYIRLPSAICAADFKR